MIYLDNAATTLHKPPEVAAAVVSAMSELGNAGRGAYGASLDGARTIYRVRALLAEFFGAGDPRRIVFTCNSTESLNIALKGLLKPGDHAITTQLEHNSVLRPLYELQRQGVGLTIVQADRLGRVDYADFERAITPQTRLIAATHEMASSSAGQSSPRVGEIRWLMRGGQCHFTVNMAEMTYTITPLNFSEYFYEIGNESGWSTAHALYGPSGDGKYQGFYYLDGEFKFKPNENDWNDDLEYVSGSADNLSGSLQSSGGPNCPDPGAGFYRVDLDAANLTYNLKKIEYVSIIGTANGNWDTDTDLTYNKTENCWEVTCDLNAGEMKFRGNHNWDGDVDLGGSFDNLVHGGSNIAVEAGNYTIKLYISIAGKHKAVVTKN